MKSKRLKNQMKLITGGKQLSFIRQTEEVLQFLEHQGLFEEKTACDWLFSHLKEDEDNLNWILDNLSIISRRDESVNGLQKEEHLEKVEKSIDYFLSWSADPIGWSRNKSSRAETRTSPPNKKRTLTFPLSAKKVIEITLPREGISQEEFRRLGLFLYPYCSDLDLTKTKSWGDDYPEPPLPRTCT